MLLAALRVPLIDWGLRSYGVPAHTWGGDDPECAHAFCDPLPHGRRGHRGISGTGGNLHPALDAVGQGGGSGNGGQFCTRCNAWRGCLGQEPEVDLFVEHLVMIFREVGRVLHKGGTLWLNLGDSYASAWPCARRNRVGQGALANGRREARPPRLSGGLKEKDLVGLPWRVALALQADGWWLRSDIIWSKPNPMPESVKTRPTRSHEYVFLLSKSEHYFYDDEAVKEPAVEGEGKWRNRRTVWTVNTKPFKGAHFATFPTALVEPCLLAGCPLLETVVDPFAGSGTVGLVAQQHDRNAILIDANPDYCAMARERLGL